MSLEANKDLIRRFHDRIMSGDPSIFDEFIADDYVDHSAWKTKEGLCKTVDTFRSTYPDMRMTIFDMIAEGDKVVIRAQARGTSEGREKVINTVSIFRIAGNKIIEHWGHSDSFF